ncbi:SusC/RagA family TonB-linked outer membrane protein [Chitinophaga sancti]|uniref:TonB-dependent receptor n=1 Tax=Chitinophaga sancti TaxID=1004 RepID=A0A1K1SKC5_9BACT|nr:TonB-dependent receptor [Chitinophaga sancti]WQD65499.1 TonB-dependent receptor [Chitinophaga sancti]WQG88878.1 TonB-dependent receptor [Chitinophaga sancti]SFW84746.1 TonB-linked outer membrane protein, SusC/RagA family [Chitinophaga sancti]
MPKFPFVSLPGILFAIFMFVSISAIAQQTTKITVTGTVTDTSGLKLEGVNVVAENKKNVATSTNSTGKFILDAEPGTLLRFSYVGFEQQYITVSPNSRVINLVLKPFSRNVEEVVVTAYGRKQRKEAVVGSVTTVAPGTLKIPSSNLTNALAGQIAGMISFQRGGQPGLDNSSFFIRGVTTFGYSASPLILVDNVELSSNDLARLQVDDIASFSILKDASAAALYGARGANGVILVTTKEGKAGKASMNVRYERSVSRPTKTVQLGDPVTYMKMYNEALTTRNPLATPLYTPNQIINTQATMDKAPGYNPYVYPAVDWMKTLFKDQATTQRANFSVQGGNDVTKYYIAGSYDRDNGILQVNPVNNFNSAMKFENYQLRSNVNVKLTKTTEVVVRLWGNFNEYTGPITGDQSGLASDLYDRALHTSPVSFPAYFPSDSANLLTKHILFGNSLTSSGNLQANPYADLMYGYKSFSESRLSAQFELNQNFDFITKGLAFHGLFSTNRYAYFDLTRSYKPFYYDVANYDQTNNTYSLAWLNNQPGGAQEFLSYYPGTKDVNTFLYLQGSLDYTRAFGKHNLSASLIGTRQQKLNADANDPNTHQPSLQYSLPYRNLGLAGRATYSFASRYFMEFNFGYNGSERFSTQYRWGFFPTVGAGWVVSNEKFWAGPLSKIVTRLKIRGSYGLVGNDNIDNTRFYYLSSVTPDDPNGPSAVFGTTNGVKMYGTTIQNYPNPGVTWETARKSNLAAEMTFFEKLNITAEIYHEFRYNILQQRGYIPVTTGLEAAVKSNVGEAYAKGLDLNINYKQTFSKNFWASVLGNLTVTSNRYARFEEPEYKYAYRFQNGKPINQPFGYIAERLFVDDKEAANSPTQYFGNSAPPAGGDIKYRDVNKDGVINQDDQVPIGLPTTPQIIYGFGFSLGYKNFDLNAFFQGLARESFFINATSQDDRYYAKYGTAPFVNNAQILQAYAENHWSEENQNLYALWPRLSTTDILNNQQQSTWWLRDGSFMRLKSVELGYSLPKSLTKRMYIRSARIYFSGLNLLTFSHFKLWDPEQAGQGFGYPIQKVFNCGINVNL